MPLVCINRQKFIQLLIGIVLYFILVMCNYYILSKKKSYIYTIIITLLTVFIWLYILFIIYKNRTPEINIMFTIISITIILFFLIVYRIIYYVMFNIKITDNTKILLNFITNIIFFIVSICWFLFIYNSIEKKNRNIPVLFFILLIILSFSYLLKIQRKYDIVYGPGYFFIILSWTLWIYYTSLIDC